MTWSMQVPVLNISWYSLMLFDFFQIILIFFNRLLIFSDIGIIYLWLILACFTLDRALQHFFETCYQLLPRVIMYVITCFTIFFWYFCATWKCYYLSARYQMCYCMHLLFIFSGTSTYLYHFWRVSRRYSQHYFKKYTNISFK